MDQRAKTARPQAASMFLAAALALAGCSLGHDDAFMCSDGVKNGAETDVDCGGPCAPCAFGRACAAASDCVDGAACSTGKCTPFKLGEPEWKPLETMGELPARYGAGVAFRSDARSVLVFGGKYKCPSTMCLNHAVFGDTWVLHLDSDPPAWTPEPTTPGPLARLYAGFADFPGFGTVLVGGQKIDGTGPLVNARDSWRYDAKGWMQIPEDYPTAQNGVAMAFDSERHTLVAFGGQPIDSMAPTLERGDTTDWKSLEIEGPPGREYAAMAYDSARHVMVLFGGSDANRKRLNDTWEYDGKKWRESAPGPGPRDRVAMAYDEARQRIVLFGGYGVPEVAGDSHKTWEYDGTTWTPFEPKQPARFGGRFNATMVYDPSRQRMLIVDGSKGGFHELAGAWQYVGFGTPCDVSDDCGKGSCVDGVCCEVDGCAMGLVCNGHENPGSCGPP